MAASNPTLQVVRKLPALPPRAAESHKGNFGRVLAVAGSRSMSGAAILCASAVLRGGAGLVRLAVPRDVQPVAAAANPCYMTAGLQQDDAGRLAADALPELLALVQENDVVAVGPGLGRTEGIDRIVAALITLGAKPMVLDADGLNSLLNQMEVLKRHSGPLVLTPHPGEFARLIGAAITSVQFR